MQANSRAVEAVASAPGAFGAPFPDLPGESILELLNRHQNVETMEVPIGSKVRMANGDEFVYLQMTGGAAELGMLSGEAAIVASDDVSSSPDLQSILDITTTPLTANAHIGDMAFIDNGLGEGQTRWIIGNGVNDIRLDRPLLTALTVAGVSDLTIIRPYRAIINPLAAIGSQPIPRAIAIGPITEDFYGWFQCKGVCQHAIISLTAVAIGDPLTSDVSSGTPGTCITHAGTTAYDLVFGNALGAGAGLVANTGTVPVLMYGTGL